MRTERLTAAELEQVRKVRVCQQQLTQADRLMREMPMRQMVAGVGPEAQITVASVWERSLEGAKATTLQWLAAELRLDLEQTRELLWGGPTPGVGCAVPAPPAAWLEAVAEGAAVLGGEGNITQQESEPQ